MITLKYNKMKYLFIIITLSLFSFAAKAQDTIRKTDGSLLIGKVKEISDDYIVYTRSDQPEGPDRKISISSVSKITYKNGTSEIFTHSTGNNSVGKSEEKEPVVGTPGTVNTSGRTVVVPRRGPDLKVRPGEMFPNSEGARGTETGLSLKSGFYVDMLVGYARTNQYSYNYNYDYELGYYYPQQSIKRDNVTFGARIGTKFYFGSNDKSRFGLNITWVNLTVLVDDANNGGIIFSPTNIGFASIFKFTEHAGLEVNTSTGLAASSVLPNDFGIKYGLDIKFRYDRLAVGIDFSKLSTVFGSSNQGANLISLTAGFKF